MAIRTSCLFLVVGVVGTVSLAPGCSPSGSSDRIVLVSRQNNSGTYHYFQEAVLGEEREFKLGTIDQSGSKDVVALVAETPSAIGYSGMAYATPDVRMLSISKAEGEPAYPPTLENVLNDHYPISRPLIIYTSGEPEGFVKEYLDWIRSEAGQKIVEDVGYVPLSDPGRPPTAAPGDAGDEGEQQIIRVTGSDTMVNLAQAWAEAYSKVEPSVSVQVGGGGSGNGISDLIDGNVDLANASRRMEPSEIARAKQRNGVEPKEFIVGRDALAVYVNKDNPIESISIPELAEIYGEGGRIETWDQLLGDETN